MVRRNSYAQAENTFRASSVGDRQKDCRRTNSAGNSKQTGSRNYAENVRGSFWNAKTTNGKSEHIISGGGMEVIMSPSNNKSKSMSKRKREFNVQAFLDSADGARKVREYKKGEIIFAQGAPAN